MLLKILTLVAVTLGFSGCNEDNKSKNLIVGMSADYPPYAYFNNGQFDGFEVELAKAIAEDMGYTIEFKDMPFDSIIGALQAGRIDFSISAISETEDRKKSVDFSTPYHDSKTVIVVEKNAKINTVQDAYQLNLGVQMGSSYETALKENQTKHPKLKIHSLSKIIDLVQDLWAKRIYGIVLGYSEGMALLKKYPELTSIDIDNTEVAYSIAFPKGSDLRDKVNKALENIKASGKYKELYQKYFND